MLNILRTTLGYTLIAACSVVNVLYIDDAIAQTVRCTTWGSTSTCYVEEVYQPKQQQRLHTHDQLPTVPTYQPQGGALTPAQLIRESTQRLLGY
jgi:hypothetical protein